MATTKSPMVIPAGWMDLGFGAGIRLPDGLAILFSIETFGEGDDCPPTGAGEYGHVSISRQERYPGWDEMRDFIYSCGFFDDRRDVMMLLPPKKNYVNVQKNCFHFYQRRERK